MGGLGHLSACLNETLIKNTVDAKAVRATYDHLILDSSIQPREFSIRAPPDTHQMYAQWVKRAFS